MKIRNIVLFCVLYLIPFSQITTYSPEEEQIVYYMSMGWAYAAKYDAPQRVYPVIDSCRNFLKKYPNSFMKQNVLAYILQMTAMVSTDMNEMTPLIDSVLYYDKLPSTKQWMGELLIKRNVDIKKGREFLLDALPDLTVPNQLYKTYLLLAQTDMQLGKYASAEMNLKNAIAVDSTRRDALYEYNNFLMMREFPQQAKAIQNKINKLNEKAKYNYRNKSDLSPNINKNVLQIPFYDLDSNSVDLSELKGKVSVVNRFNFWCGLCMKEFPILKKIIKEFPDVEFIFNTAGESPSELRDRYFPKKEFSFLKNHKVLLPKREYFDKIYGHGVPHTFIVDKKGNIRFDYIGYNEEIENLLREKLTELLNE